MAPPALSSNGNLYESLLSNRASPRNTRSCQIRWSATAASLLSGLVRCQLQSGSRGLLELPADWLKEFIPAWQLSQSLILICFLSSW
jgi:hypothetical protein